MERFKINFFAIAVALLACATAALAQPMPAVGRGDVARDAVVSAAQRDGVESLRQQVGQMAIAHGVTVGELVKRFEAADAFTAVINGAKPIGGPRWIDDRTCQVRVELPARPIAELLLDRARARPEQSPVPVSLLEERLANWRNLIFSAVGSGTGGETIELARPGTGGGAWAAVGEEASRKAIREARQDAVNHLLDEMAPVPLGTTALIRDAEARPKIRQLLNDQLRRSPVTKVEFLDDLSVAVTLSPSPEMISSVLESAMQSDPEFAGTMTVDWKAVRQQIANVAAPAIGRARITVAATAAVVEVPRQPPAWVNRLIQAEATAAGAAPPLKLARTAETAAVGKLRDQLLALPLSATSSVGDASKADPAMAEAVDRATHHAHTFKVDYRADGSVLVRMQLDLRDAWQELALNR